MPLGHAPPPRPPGCVSRNRWPHGQPPQADRSPGQLLPVCEAPHQWCIGITPQHVCAVPSPTTADSASEDEIPDTDTALVLPSHTYSLRTHGMKCTDIVHAKILHPAA